jgi:hypothetical protein
VLLFCPVLAWALEGRVLDAEHGQPLAGAIVTAGSEVVYTDVDGRYHLSAPASRVMARAIGYGRASVAAPADGEPPPLRLAPVRPKALYLSIYGIGDAGLREAAVKLVDSTELNALVIDMKGDRGLVPYPSKVPQAAQCGARSVTTVRDMAGTVASLKERGIYLIARVVVFKDDPLAAAHPEWTVRTAQGAVFRDRERLAWIDPSRRESWDYALDLAAEAAELGFDEIQFDYVRFPDSAELLYAVPNTQANRVAAITGFLAAARKRLTPYNVFLAADVFGYVAWNENDTSIGQDLEEIVGVVDYVSMMLYPSGYSHGIPGYTDPVQHPYEIVYRTLRRAIDRTGVSPLRFRPWLQAFRDYAFDRRPFDADEIGAQVHAAEQAGSDGWMLWNPHNVYAPFRP